MLPPALQLGLIERLTNIMPKGLDKFFFANSGSEAVDNAVKIARAHTGRQNIIAFEVSHPAGGAMLLGSPTPQAGQRNAIAVEVEFSGSCCVRRLQSCNSVPEPVLHTKLLLSVVEHQTRPCRSCSLPQLHI